MPKLSVIVTFDVTEPNLQHCLDSLYRQSGIEGTEIVLVPVRAQADPAQSAVPAAPADGPNASEAVESGENGENGEETENGGMDLVTEDDPDDAGTSPDDEGGESVDTARSEGLATAREAVADPAPGLTLLDEPAPSHAAARARGTRASTGDYLVFLYGADALVGYALSYLVGSLDASGADIATGNVYRFNELGSRQSAAHRRIFADERTATDVRATPSLLGDRILGNKVWRRSFWEGLPDLGFTDSDTDLLAVRALFAARSVDVLPAPVLLRRDREDRTDLSEITAMTRRLTAIATLSGSLSGTDRELWDAGALKSDVRAVLLRLDDASDAAWERFFELANAYLDNVGRDVLAGLSALQRLNYYLVRRRQGERLLETITFQKSVELKKAQVVRRGLHYYIRYPFFDDSAAGVPREIYRIEPELKVRQKTEGVEWRDGRLLVRGRVGLPHLRARRRWQQHLVAFAVHTETGRRVPVPVKVRRAAEYRLPDVADAARHDYGGFEIALDPSRLRTSGQWRAAEWRLELVVINRGLVRRRTVGNPVAGQPERPPYHRVAGDVWVRPAWNAKRELIIAVDPERARVTRHRVDYSGRPELEITGEFVSPPAAESHTMRLRRLPGTAELEYPLRIEGGCFSARVPVAELLNHAVDEGRGQLRQEQWEVGLRTVDGTLVPLVLPDEADLAAYPAGDGHHEVAVQRTSTGYLRVRAGWGRPAVRGAEWSGHELVLSGYYAAHSEMELLFKARGHDEEHRVPTVRDGTTFRASFSPAEIETLAGTVPLPAGTYQLWARVRLACGDSSDIAAELDADFVRSLPLQLTTPERTFTFTDSGFDTPVLKVGSDLRPEERGTFAQRQLREVSYPAMRQESVREEILFDSFTGRQFSDSPHSVYTELRSRQEWADYPMSWLVKDGQVTLPPDLTRVRHNGTDFYESLARCRYLVTNSRQPAWFTRRPGQTVVQTWHGSMLKRIGFDIENIRGKSRDYHEKLAWETQQWDYLVSPSPWATPILRRAFRFDGEILETGYPRNDIFFSPERDAIAARTRRRLGLPDDKKVILYAPTWRDDKYYTRGKHKLDLHLDLRRMYAKLGDDHVLLVRRHPRVVDSVPIVGTDFVYDVSLYPEIMELFLVTDILVTDYSSMMFDFANTGRPMLFFTYDIESYRDDLRGFYFDFEETAPGPLLLESDDVIGALADIDGVAESYREKYRAFTDQFCPLDDGNAAARVVDRVFGRR
ncbi:CDP-glycerol glycerophosphotransferase family protein [Halostreptopolyspora alba]|uniref:CDP-glycerol glycerophosphotransferase family protein n=1 Tax=Halostreptopolyspora alba TaxID=2487137 RepID=A0A3N0EEM4_9ACTN|nr:CDP-glycerol glycerophosphotransferase family protein [Nocardiopsaceae bacterium YIM 96095]